MFIRDQILKSTEINIVIIKLVVLVALNSFSCAVRLIKWLGPLDTGSSSSDHWILDLVEKKLVRVGFYQLRGLQAIHSSLCHNGDSHPACKQHRSDPYRTIVIAYLLEFRLLSSTGSNQY